MKHIRASLLLALTALASAQTTLREAAAQRSLLFGAAANADEFGMRNRLSEPEYAATLSRQFNMLEAENAMKWSVVRPTRDSFNFGPGDKLAAFAEANNMKLRGHVLLWHSGMPSWVAPFAASATPAQMSTLLEEHIRTVVGHYKGKVFAWDVVNEAFTDPAGPTTSALRNSVWHNQPGIGRTGTAYIEQAFRWAHEADPDALLFYNDYSIEGAGSKFQAVLTMLKDFIARGVPVHGLGLQMHLTTSGFPPDASLAENMRQVAALGLQVHFTEMDVRLPVDSSGAASERDLQTQAATYGRILGHCLAVPKCTAIQTWGFTDLYSWVPSFYPGLGAALPFDRSYRPKAAVEAMLNAMRTVPPVLTSTAIVNAASYKTGALAPGELITIFDAKYGPGTLVNAQLTSDNKLTTDLDSTKVTFDGIPAPLVYALSGQISAIVPYEIAGRSETTVQYEFNGVRSNTVTVPVTNTAPAIFAADATGTGPGLILKLDYSVNSAANPSNRGDAVLVLATGAGAISGGAVSGALAPGAGQQTETITATVAGIPAPVLYAGPAPGLVNGILQVNLTIPPEVPSGAQPLILRVGGIETQRGITIEVR